MPNDTHLIKIPEGGNKLSVALFFIQFLLVTANLYLSNGYVSKAIYEADTKDAMLRRESLNAELRGIAIELRGIKDHMLGDEKQDEEIKELKSRVRELEKRP